MPRVSDVDIQSLIKQYSSGLRDKTICEQEDPTNAQARTKDQKRNVRKLEAIIKNVDQFQQKNHEDMDHAVYK